MDGDAIRRVALLVPVAQPVHEGEHLLVPPHPRREAAEGVPLLGAPRSVHVSHIAVDPRCVRPVGLERHEPDPATFDQLPGDTRPHPVELGCAMRGLADEDQGGVSDPIEQRAQIDVVDGGDGFGRFRDEGGQVDPADHRRRGCSLCHGHATVPTLWI